MSVRQFFGWLTIAGLAPLSISTPVLLVLCALCVSAALLALACFLAFFRVFGAVLSLCCDVMLCQPESVYSVPLL